jgi:hypothetical protein
MKLIEEISLSNGLNLKIFDLSRPVAADTFKVEISFQTKVDLKESYFSSPQDYAQVKNIMGAELTYENKKVRSFVHEKDQDSIRENLINTFKNNSLAYVDSANFPQKLALSILRDIRKNPYKYHPHTYSDSEA